MKTVTEHLFDKVVAWRSHRGSDVCFAWSDTMSLDKYGRIVIGKKRFHTHHLAYEIKKGRIPKNRAIHHTCGNNGCVNPRHLYIGRRA